MASTGSPCRVSTSEHEEGSPRGEEVRPAWVVERRVGGGRRRGGVERVDHEPVLVVLQGDDRELGPGEGPYLPGEVDHST